MHQAKGGEQQCEDLVPVGNNREAPQNNERAMVAHQFFWEDQVHALNLTGDENANLAQIEDSEESIKAE